MDASRRGLMVASSAILTGMGFQNARSESYHSNIAAAHLINTAVQQSFAAHACPGVAVMIGKPANLIFSQGYGLANIETSTPVLTESVFRIGSLTKQFVAAAIIKLASQGTLNIDAPVGRYLPFMSKLKSMSLLELMHHTAGLHSDEDGVSCPAGPNGPKSQIRLAEEIAGQTKPFDFDPGTAWLYSNANYIVLGAVIESITKSPLSTALTDIIFTPLGLTATAIDHSTTVVPRRVSGYTPTGRSDGPFENADYVEISDAGGAGAMRSSVLDLFRWHEALLGAQIFDEKNVLLMITPGRLRDGRLSGANRFSPNDANYGGVQYACGLLVSPPTDENRSIIHYGGINGFSAVLETYLDSRVTVAVLCNGDTGPNLPFRGIRRAVVSAILSQVG